MMRCCLCGWPDGKHAMDCPNADVVAPNERRVELLARMAASLAGTERFHARMTGTVNFEPTETYQQRCNEALADGAVRIATLILERIERGG